MGDMHGERHLAHFTRFYEAESQRLINTVALATGERDLAEEAVAEAFARAWLRWPHLSHESRTPAGWIIQVALNECRGRWRRRRIEWRKAPVVARADVSHDPDPPASQVWDAVAQLPERERLLIALRYVADLPQDEIARTLGLAAGTVASSLHRARQRLGVELRPTYEETNHG